MVCSKWCDRLASAFGVTGTECAVYDAEIGGRTQVAHVGSDINT